MAQDKTKYLEGKVPDQEVKTIFMNMDLNEAWRLKLANAGWTTVESMANLSIGDPQKLEDRVVRMFPDAAVDDQQDVATVQERFVLLSKIVGAFRAASSRKVNDETRREKMLDDPTKVPQIGETERQAARGRYAKAHTDDTIDDDTEPHDSFVDELKAAFEKHANFVEVYSVSVMYLQSEKLEKTHGVVPTLEKVLQIGDKFKPKWCTSPEMVVKKVNGMFVGLEYTQVANHSKESGTRHYISKLKKFNAQHNSTEMVIKLDWECRKKIKEYQIRHDQRRSFSEAMLLMLDRNFDAIEQKVVSDKVIADVQGAIGGRSSQSDGAGQDISRMTNTQIRKYMTTRTLQQHGSEPEPPSDDHWRPNPKPWRDKGGHKGKGKGKGKSKKNGVKGAFAKGAWARKGGGKDKEAKSIPPKEFAEMSKVGDLKGRCRFWNSTVGCSKGKNCQFEHSCALCGDRKHKWCEKHFSP